MLMPATGAAQAPATNFRELRFKVAPGNTIYVTDQSGRETAVEVLDLSEPAVLVRQGGERRTLAEADVRRIRQRLPDRLWNGALIGFGIGAGLGALVASIMDECSSGGGAACAGPVIGYSALGSAVGVGIDALIKGRKIIYEAPRTTTSMRLALTPTLSTSVKGARLTVLF
jgi:hypothetical protein